MGSLGLWKRKKVTASKEEVKSEQRLLSACLEIFTKSWESNCLSLIKPLALCETGFLFLSNTMLLAIAFSPAHLSLLNMESQYT